MRAAHYVIAGKMLYELYVHNIYVFIFNFKIFVQITLLAFVSSRM